MEITHKIQKKKHQARVRRTKWWEAPRVSQLKKEIEHEAAHLPLGGGERQENILFVLGRAAVNRHTVHTFVAEEHGELIGFLSIMCAKFKKMRGNAEIVLSVRESHRGRGIGTLLLEAAEVFALARAIRRLELEVFGKNEGAIRLYERLGYEREGLRRRAVEHDDGYDDVVFMAKFLK